MGSLLSVFILFLGFFSIASARRINLIVKKTNGWHDSATIQSVDYEKLGRKGWDELTDVERYLLETEHALRGLNSNSVSEEQEGEYDEIAQDNYEDTGSEENVIEDSDEDEEENSVSDEAFEGDENNNGKDKNDGSNENQSKEEDDESEDSDEDSAEDESTETDESLPEKDVHQEYSDYNYRRRIGGRAARVWNTRQYQYYHLSVHYLINVYVKLRSKIDV